MAAGLVPLLNPTATIPPKEPDLGVDPAVVDPIPDPYSVPFVQSLVSDDSRIVITPEGPSVGETPSKQGNLVITSNITAGDYTSWLDVDLHLANAGASFNAGLSQNWYVKVSGAGTKVMPNPIGLIDGAVFYLNIIRTAPSSKVITFDDMWRFPDGTDPINDYLGYSDTQSMMTCVYVSPTTMLGTFNVVAWPPGFDNEPPSYGAGPQYMHQFPWDSNTWAKLTNGVVFVSQPTNYLYRKP